MWLTLSLKARSDWLSGLIGQSLELIGVFSKSAVRFRPTAHFHVRMNLLKLAAQFGLFHLRLEQMWQKVFKQRCTADAGLWLAQAQQQGSGQGSLLVDGSILVCGGWAMTAMRSRALLTSLNTWWCHPKVRVRQQLSASDAFQRRRDFDSLISFVLFWTNSFYSVKYLWRPFAR